MSAQTIRTRQLAWLVIFGTLLIIAALGTGRSPEYRPDTVRADSGPQADAAIDGSGAGLLGMCGAPGAVNFQNCGGQSTRSLVPGAAPLTVPFAIKNTGDIALSVTATPTKISCPTGLSANIVGSGESQPYTIGLSAGATVSPGINVSVDSNFFGTANCNIRIVLTTSPASTVQEAVVLTIVIGRVVPTPGLTTPSKVCGAAAVLPVGVTPTPVPVLIGTTVPPGVHRFEGCAYLDGQVMSNVVVKARINGQICGYATTGPNAPNPLYLQNGSGYFVLDVSCGPQNAQITFTVGDGKLDYPATQSASWSAGSYASLELSAFTRNEAQSCSSTVLPFGVTPTPDPVLVGRGVPPGVHRFVGCAFLDGQAVGNRAVRAWINDRLCGEAYTEPNPANTSTVQPKKGQFVLDVACGPQNEPIRFTVSDGTTDFSATHGANWSAGTLAPLDLSAYTKIVTPTPTVTPAPAATGTPAPNGTPAATDTLTPRSPKWLTAPVPLGTEACPPSGAWQLLYWGGAHNTTIATAAAVCPDSDRFWISRSSRWFGFTPKAPEASDAWAAFTGEAHFVHTYDLGPNAAIVQTPATPVPTPTPVENARIALRVASPGQLDEFVEITNNERSAIAMSGWYLVRERGSYKFEFPSGFVIQPGQTCRLYSNKPAPEWCGLNWNSPAAVWDTKTDVATLFTQDGTRITRQIYGP